MPLSQGLIVEKIELISHRRLSGNALDLTEYYSTLELNEDIFANTIYGTLTLKEVHNIVSSPVDKSHSQGPIIGQERVVVWLSEKKNNSRLRLSMVIYKIETRVLTNTKVQMTVLNLVNEDFIENGLIKISRSYKNKKYSTIVSEILRGELKTEKNIDIEETDNPKNIIVPYWNPFSAINWIASRSISATETGASYLFFETLNNNGTLSNTYHFRTLESLYTFPEIKNLETTIANIYDPVSQANEHYEASARRINKYDFRRSFNILENIGTGMYANTLFTHDIKKKKIEKTYFNYIDSFGSTKHLDKGPLLSELKYVFTEKPEQNMSLYIKNNAMYSGQDDASSMQYILYRKSQLQQIANVRLLVDIPGDATLSVGNVVNLKLTSPKISSDIGGNALDRYYSGKYIISCLSHIIQNEAPGFGVYSMTLELSKDTLFNNPLSEGQLP